MRTWYGLFVMTSSLLECVFRTSVKDHTIFGYASYIINLCATRWHTFSLEIKSIQINTRWSSFLLNPLNWSWNYGQKLNNTEYPQHNFILEKLWDIKENSNPKIANHHWPINRKMCRRWKKNILHRPYKVMLLVNKEVLVYYFLQCKTWSMIDAKLTTSKITKETAQSRKHSM